MKANSKTVVTTVFAEFGPGYEWNKKGTPGETVLLLVKLE
jgi:hypothetical protein